MRARTMFRLGILLLAAACQDTNEAVAPETPVAFAASGRPTVLPNGQKLGTLIDSVGPRAKNRIEAHYGPVIDGPANIYFIWYGNWAGDITTLATSPPMTRTRGEQA